MPLVQVQPVVFGQNICYLFYLKSAWSHFVQLVKYSLFWLESVQKLKMHTAPLP